MVKLLVLCACINRKQQHNIGMSFLLVTNAIYILVITYLLVSQQAQISKKICFIVENYNFDAWLLLKIKLKKLIKNRVHIPCKSGIIHYDSKDI